MKNRLLLSKTELKKMFLRVLHEIQYGEMRSYSSGVDSIVSQWMNRYFNIELYPKEKELIHEAIQELKNSGLIAQDPTQSSTVFQRLTDKGKKIVENQQDPDVFSLRLEEVIENQELLEHTLDSFNDGDYDSAIFNAFKLVEETVRAKAGLDVKDIGVTLMSKALNPTNGRLVIPKCLVVAEQEGVHSLFRGAIGFFKNPTSHRTVNYNDRMEAIQVIVFAEVLLNILSKAILR